MAELRRVRRYEWLPILRRLKCDPSVKFVGFAAASYGNGDGESIFPGIVRLANVTGYDDRTVKLGLAALRDFGLMLRVFEGSSVGRSGGMADEHVLTVPGDLSLLPLLPVDESDPERDKKRSKAREADLQRKRRKKEQVISDPEQVISGTGTGDLSSRIPVSQITPPWDAPRDVRTQEDQHSARSERGHAAARPRPDGAEESFAAFEARHHQLMAGDGETLSEEDKQFVSSVTAHDYVCSIAGELSDSEESTVAGMISGGAHPKAILNTILKVRGEGEADYRDAQGHLLTLADDLRQLYLSAAQSHAEHYPGSTHRYVTIFAARLSQRDMRLSVPASTPGQKGAHDQQPVPRLGRTP